MSHLYSKIMNFLNQWVMFLINCQFSQHFQRNHQKCPKCLKLPAKNVCTTLNTFIYSMDWSIFFSFFTAFFYPKRSLVTPHPRALFSFEKYFKITEFSPEMFVSCLSLHIKARRTSVEGNLYSQATGGEES